jgi:hypothetical protein
MAKVIIYLRDHELTALNDLAQSEYRVPKAQAALIIRRELEKLGMIPGEQPAHPNPIESLSDGQEKPVIVGG